jgi:trans-aconitate methyltransferase
VDLCECTEFAVKRHPWELARADFFLRVLRETTRGTRPLRCLDVGCGDGWFGRQLLAQGGSVAEVTGWDVELDEARLHDLSADLPAGMTLTREAPAGRFDLLLLMDVLEHVEDDAGFLQRLVDDYLAPGGLLLCSVPAWQHLFSPHDEALKHFRRYAPRQGLARLEGAGLRVVRSGGLFHSLLVVRWLQVATWKRWQRLAERSRQGVGGWNGSAPVTQSIRAVLFTEGLFSGLAASAGLDVPGLSWWALCRKP